MPRTEPSTIGTRTPGVERSIGERPSNRCGIPVTGIRRIYPPEANGALGRDADGCASCCRRFGVWRANAEQHRVRERRASAACRRSLRGVGGGYPWLGGAAAGIAAEGRAEPYCDVDLLWDVPDAAFAEAIASLPVFMARVRPLASLRFDPDFQHSARRRLAFVRFAGVPLF
jgi:hypothetical protein